MLNFYLGNRVRAALATQCGTSCLLLLMLLGAPLLARAQSIITYPINSLANSDNTTTSLGPTGVNANLIASPLTLHYDPAYVPGNSTTTLSGPQSDKGLFAMYQFPGATTYDPTSPQYLEFTLAPRPGYLLNIPSILLTLRGKPNGPNSFDFRASLDNFNRTSPTATSDVLLNTYPGTSTVKGITLTSTLPAAFINTTKTITFRLYGYNASNNGGFAGDKPGGVYQNPDGTDFSISGTVPVRPTAVTDVATTAPATPVTFAVTGNDLVNINGATIDLDPATAGIQTTFTVAGQGTFTTAGVTAGSVQFTPVAGFTGTAVTPYLAAQTTTGTLTNPANLVVTVRPPAPADLSTTIAASASMVNAGAPVTFTLVGRNNSALAAANVQETLQLPVGLSATGFTANTTALTSNTNGVYTFGDGTTYNVATGVVTFPVLSTLAATATQNYSVTFNAPGSGPFTATDYIGNGTVDPTPANNVASAPVTIVNPSFDVTTQLLGPASTTAGDLVTYTVLTGNNGPSLASAAVQTVQLPKNLSGVFATNGGTYDAASGVVTFAAVPLAPGKTVTNTVSFTAPSASYAASALVTPNTTATGDTNPANNTAFLNGATAAANTTVNAASGTATNLYVTVTGPAVVNPGQTGVTYTVTEGNKGPVSAASVATLVSLPTGLDPATLALNGATGSFSAGTGLVTFGAGSGNGNTATYNVNTGVLTLPTLASQAVTDVQTYAIALTAPSTGPSYPVVASVSTPTPETVAADNVAAVVTQEFAPVDVATVISGPATTVAGQNVTYAVTTLNNSSFTANTVVQTVSIPAGLTTGLLVNGALATATNAAGVQTFANGATYNPATGLLTFASLTTLAGGAAVENTFTYPAPGALTQFANVASVSTTSADGLQPNNTSTVLTTETAAGDVTVAVSGPAVAVFGSLVTYEVTTTNNGPTATTQTTTAQLPTSLTGVLVRDAAGTLLANTATTGYNSADGVVRFPTATAQALGATNALTGTIQVPMPDAARLVVTAVTGVPTGTLDTNLDNNVATVATTGGSPNATALDLQITIASNVTTQTAGQPVTFTVTTKNNSATVAANNVAQLVALPTGLTGVKVNNAAPTSTDATTGVQTFTGGATYDPRTGLLTLPALTTLAANGTALTTVTVNAPGAVTTNAAGQRVFAATAAVTTDNAETLLTNNTATAPVLLTDAAEVATFISGPATTAAGNAVTYTVVTSNNGPSPAIGLVQTVTIPANASASAPVVSGGGTVAAGGSPAMGYTITFPAYTAQVGSSQTNTVSFTAGSLTSYTLTATVPTANDPVPANNTSTQTTTEPNRPPVANDVVNRLQAPEGNTAGQLLISPLQATDPDGTIDHYNLASIPPVSQGVLYYNTGTTAAPSYQALTTATNLATLNLTPTQAQTLRFDPASTFVGTVNFLYTATDNAGLPSNTAQYTLPVGQDNNSTYTATPIKGASASAYQNGDVLAYGIDPNGASYNASGLVYNANGTSATGTPSSGLASASLSAADLATLAANGIGFDPATGLFTVADRTKLPRTATSFPVTITTTDVVGGTNTQPFTFSTGANPLPVELVEFTATAKSVDAQLVWRTASEQNNDYFDVERSLTGTDFVKIGQVKGQGNTMASTAYALTDAGIGKQATGTVYYRLKQVDADGTTTYSPVRTVAFTAGIAPVIAVYPNPATATTQLDLTQLPAGSYQVSVVDLLGRTVQSSSHAAGTRPVLNLQPLPAGSYVVFVRSASLQLSSRLVKE